MNKITSLFYYNTHFSILDSMIVLTSLHDQALEIEEGAKDEGEGEGDEEIERTKNE